ncbi:MAG: DNA-binding protein [Acidobacteria bacterium]|nr:MAG: DNA-binding protein [Acidobacteriota bacterium]
MSRPVPRIALTRQEAAEALGVGLTTFKQKIAPELRVIREGKVRLYPVRELERWAEDRAERVIDHAA